MKVAFDTNVLVSAFATRGLCADLLRLVLAEHQLIIGVTVLRELRRTLGRTIGIPTVVVEEITTFLQREAIVSDQAVSIRLKLRDPSDVRVLAEAVAANADVLVTGDRDLLDVADKAPLPIMTPRAFWESLRVPRE